MKVLAQAALCAALNLAIAAQSQDATAQTRPSADAVRSTWDYFYKGQGQGPILVDAKLCLEVARDGPNKSECIAEVNPASGVVVNAPVVLWQAYMAPQGDTYEDLRIDLKSGSVLRETKDVKILGRWRTRVWTGVQFRKAGAWTVIVRRGSTVLKSIEVKVVEAPVSPAPGAPTPSAPPPGASTIPNWPQWFTGAETDTPFRWLDGATVARSGFANAAPGGRESNGTLYLCRAYYRNGVHLGKVYAGKCNIGWGGREQVLASGFEVLVNTRPDAVASLVANWVPAPASGVAYVGNHPMRGTLPMRVCRAYHRNGVHPGKEWEGKCNIGWGGQEVAVTPYEVLQLGFDRTKWVQ